MDYHSHTAGDVGAAPEGHHHSAYDVGAAEDGHRHYPHEAGASPEGHEHQLHQVAGAASASDVDDLRSQGRQQWDRLTLAESAIRDLQAQNTILWAQLHAEVAANAALRAGAVTIPLLVTALRVAASRVIPTVGSGSLVHTLANLADAIEREAR
jgi:hypothetical protein